ncbi:hypothetical protein OSTOST_21366 [Ostertagia ostertagi]
MKPAEEVKPLVEEKLVEVTEKREVTIEEIAEASAIIEAIFTKTEEISGLEIDLITSPYDSVAHTAPTPIKKKVPEEETHPPAERIHQQRTQAADFRQKPCSHGN